MGINTVHQTPAENALTILVSGLVSGLIRGSLWEAFFTRDLT